MDARYTLEVRSWQKEQHLRHISEGEWLPMKDADGNILEGIAGKPGVAGMKPDGSEIGADFIKMDPGAGFKLHVHDGDHEIYFILGEGFVHIDGDNIPVHGGHVIHIPGEYPHGVWVAPEAERPLIFFAVGHPHKHIQAEDRMRHPHER